MATDEWLAFCEWLYAKMGTLLNGFRPEIALCLDLFFILFKLKMYSH
jgi:hypothetical protein